MIIGRNIVLPVVLLCTSPLVSHARADVLIRLTNDLFGNTTGTVTGTFDTTGGINTGATAGSADRFFRNGNGFTFQRRTTPATSNSSRSFAPVVNPGAILTGTFMRAPTQFTTDDIWLRLDSGAFSSAGIATYNGNNTGTFNESFTYNTIPITSFNTGTWEWGTYGGAANDGIRLEISAAAAAVPEPACFGVLAMGLSCMTLRRRRKTKTY